jgi:hypothetical protein
MLIGRATCHRRPPDAAIAVLSKGKIYPGPDMDLVTDPYSIVHFGEPRSKANRNRMAPKCWWPRSAMRPSHSIGR